MLDTSRIGIEDKPPPPLSNRPLWFARKIASALPGMEGAAGGAAAAAAEAAEAQKGLVDVTLKPEAQQAQGGAQACAC